MWLVLSFIGLGIFFMFKKTGGANADLSVLDSASPVLNSLPKPIATNTTPTNTTTIKELTADEKKNLALANMLQTDNYIKSLDFQKKVDNQKAAANVNTLTNILNDSELQRQLESLKVGNQTYSDVYDSETSVLSITSPVMKAKLMPGAIPGRPS